MYLSKWQNALVQNEWRFDADLDLELCSLRIWGCHQIFDLSWEMQEIYVANQSASPFINIIFHFSCKHSYWLCLQYIDLTWKILDTSKADQLPWEYFFKSGALASRAPTDFHWLKVLRIAGLTVQSWGWEVRKAGPWDASEERRVQCWCICDAQHHLGLIFINN